MTDKEYYQLTISISKALSGIEMPLKVKHARAAIIGTFHTQGAHSFWAITLRQPLQENRITAWKFCHLLHKVLREGHPLCCQHSMRHRSMLSELGKLWGHLNDGYGLCIRHYTKLLITKLEFHDRNPRISGHLSLKRGELEAIAGNDINFYFEMAVEMFDYLDDIIALQATIFNSLTTFHVNSMTSAGQCRLSPLIPLIQDSNQLYDFLVRIMFKLHGNLPNDVLGGHRDRFRAIFTQLKSFYNQSRNLQYFVNLITVPKLPENAPNFSSQIEFGSYTAPVVVIPEPDPEPEPIVDNLVDMTSSPPPRQRTPTPVQQATPEPNIALEQIIHERDDLIKHLQTEVDRCRKCLKMVAIDHRNEQVKLEEQVVMLNTQLSDTQEELINLKFVKDELELRAQSAEKAQVEEEKIRANEEKFVKLKVMYAQIRDEHIKLLRQHGDVKKQLGQQQKLTNEITKEKEEFRLQIEEQQNTQKRAEENLQQSSSKLEKEKIDMAERMQALENENSVLSAKFDDLRAQSETAKAEFTEVKANFEKEILQLKENEQLLRDEKCKIEEEIQLNQEQKIKALEFEQETVNKQYEDLKSSSTLIQEEKCSLEAKLMQITKDQDELTLQLSESAQALSNTKSQLTEQINLNNELKEQFNAELESKSSEIASLKTSMVELQERYELLNTNTDRIRSEKDQFETDLQDLLHEQEELKEKHNVALSTIQTLEATINDVNIREEIRLRALVEACIKTSEKLVTRAIAENDVTGASGTSVYFTMIAEELQNVLNSLIIVHSSYVADKTNVEGFARKVILGGHLMALVHVQGAIVCNTSADIEAGEKITEEIKKWSTNVQDLFSSFYSIDDSSVVKDRIDTVKTNLQKITTMIHDLSKKIDSTESIGDIIESELAGMDKAIEAAASSIEKMLSNARSSDSGIKLEVNEKILDACTVLMNNIRILVQKSRLLQAEIVSLGKGTASVTEFYKRNHQWTEGLISAAKSVAQGANFLVTAANKAVSGESQHQLDLIVAAQEIAACTAQLVVSSRVKAPRTSSNLSALGQASRDVTQSTGAVVATVKDCAQRLEESQDMDLTNLTVHQAKTREMEIQVKVLELEQALQVARSKLATFRRNNYRES